MKPKRRYSFNFKMMQGAKICGGKMKTKRCSAFNCGFYTTDEKYKFCPMCGAQLGDVIQNEV